MDVNYYIDEALSEVSEDLYEKEYDELNAEDKLVVADLVAHAMTSQDLHGL